VKQGQKGQQGLQRRSASRARLEAEAEERLVVEAEVAREDGGDLEMVLVSIVLQRLLSAGKVRSRPGGAASS
jgi:hypothetical protein